MDCRNESLYLKYSAVVTCWLLLLMCNLYTWQEVFSMGLECCHVLELDTHTMYTPPSPLVIMAMVNKLHRE